MRLQDDPDRHISFESYVRWVRSHETEQGLLAIGRVCHALEMGDPRLKGSKLGKHDVGQWQLAHYAKTLIVASNDFRSGKTDDEEAYLASNYYNNIREPQVADPDSPEGRRELLNALIRLSYTQFPCQMTNHRADIPRSIIMFDDLAGTASKDGFNVEQAFLRITGLAVREFLFNGFAVWAYAGAGAIPAHIKTSVTGLQGLLQPAKQDKFRALVSASYTRFRECQDKQMVKPGFEKQQFNCLQIYPLIWTEKSRLLVCPVPLYLIHRVTRGIYYYLQDAYSAGGAKNDFTQFFGKYLFEPYVGMQLRDLATVSELLPEQQIGSELTCDWILVEGDHVTLVECKTLGLTQRAKALAETETVAEDLRKRIVKAVQACERTRIALNRGIPGLERLKGKKTRNLIVFYDDIFLFNSLLYRELIIEDLKKIGLVEVPFQVCSIRELEYLIPIVESRGLGLVLDEKMADRERATWDLGTYMNRLIADGVLKTNGPNRILDKKFDELFGGFDDGANRP